MFPDDDFWAPRSNGDHTCSYCGSLHPDQFIEHMRRYLIDADGYGFDKSEEDGRIALVRQGVRRHFFCWHSPMMGGLVAEPMRALLLKSFKKAIK
jgi:hypothetical protein